MLVDEFFIAGKVIIKASEIKQIDISEVERLRIEIEYGGGVVIVEGIQVIEILMVLKPSVLENKRLRWVRGAWAVHNLVGHPVMQILAFMGRYRMAMRVHDWTVPRPKGIK
jgi:hypothetical protein